MITLLVMTDGRDNCLDLCIASARKYLSGRIDEWWMHDDTGDDTYRARLAARYPQFTHINGGQRRGFDGAINNAWRLLGEGSQARHVFHLEQDFIFRRAVDLDAVADVLRERPYLAQMALRRQPWNDAERAAGGVVEANPASYAECHDQAGREWLQHRLFWTTNPSLYRLNLCRGGWCLGPRSEGMFTHRLLAEGTPEVPGYRVRFGYWGARESGEWVEHIGTERAGTGY